MTAIESTKPTGPADFVRGIVADDVAAGKYDGRVVTRFPPEPNGYLHIGHAKSACLNFGVAVENGGACHLRFDDTNPTKEEVEYVQSIQEDVRWLGWDWGDHLYFASDYFEELYEYAVRLIKMRTGPMSVALSPQEIREYRGTLTETGAEQSLPRGRSVAENLDLFERMRAGEFDEGSPRAAGQNRHGLSPNLNLRDPVIYRILKASSTTGPGTLGAFTPLTILPTASPIPSKV